MSAISGIGGKLVAADGISGLERVKDLATTIKEVVDCFYDHSLSKRRALEIMKERAENILRILNDDENNIPTVEEYLSLKENAELKAALTPI